MASLMDILAGAGNLLDLPGSSLRDILSGRNPFDQWATPFSDVNRASGRDVLQPFLGANEETGMSGWMDNPMEGFKDIAGFGAEMLLDPLNLVPLGAVGKALKGRKAMSVKGILEDKARLAKTLKSNPVGRGGNAVVFDIPGTNYVLRKPHKVQDVLQDFNQVEDALPGMNVGQAVATNSQGVSVLRKQPGFPAGITTRTESPDDLLQYANAVRSAAMMPQSAYDGFAKDLSELTPRGFQFDPSKSNNVLIDPGSGRFNLVDINPNPTGYQSGLTDMLVPLMGNTFHWKYQKLKDSGAFDQELTQSFRDIFSKAKQAAESRGLPTKLGSSGDYSHSFARFGDEAGDAAASLEQSQRAGFTFPDNPMQLQPEPSPFPAAVAGAVYNALQAFNGRGGIQ